MKVYIAGPLYTKEDRKFLEKINKMCKRLGLKTFLPHKDCGLLKNVGHAKKIATGDIKGLENCKLIIASLNGFNVGAGTAWEIGYAYAKKIPVIAIKTDRKPEKAIEEISAIIFGTTKIVTSLKDLEKEVRKLIRS